MQYPLRNKLEHPQIELRLKKAEITNKLITSAAHD